MKNFLLTLVIGLLTATPALAQTPSQEDVRTADSLNKVIDTIKGILNNITTLIVGEIAGGIVVLMVIVGGIQYITGDKAGGKKTIVAALVGAAIIVLSYAIINLVNIIG
ncbi:MAG: TrbC/VirB2 family protein [Patescibacteria group bacterium]|jgi:type IV secretory pathway VirB2 component (pilin)